MREIKFRAWDSEEKKMFFIDGISGSFFAFDGEDSLKLHPEVPIMQYTGLKDKNGLQDIYEDDIIDLYGNIKGNTYEMDKCETDLVIQGFGTKAWLTTYQEAVARGCKDS